MRTLDSTTSDGWGLNFGRKHTRRMSLSTASSMRHTGTWRYTDGDRFSDAALEHVVWSVQVGQMLKMRIYRREIRFSFNKFDLILYRFWPYRFRKVVYPDGPNKAAAGAFSFNRSPSEQVHSHANYLFWDAEIRRRYAVEGADGVVVGGGDVPAAPVPSSQ